jgi:hypothetical protein
MTDEPVSLNEQRALKAENNALWTPHDCIKAFKRDLENGLIKPSKVLIIFEEDLEDGESRISAYRANMQRDTEIALLYMMLHNAARKWIAE